MNAIEVLPKETAKLSSNLGLGLAAGALGTLAITLSRMADMKITGSEESTAPSDAAGKVLGVVPRDKKDEKNFSNVVHWSYGTGWGATRGILATAGIRGWKASLLQFVALWGTEMILLPSLKVAPPIQEQSPKEILKDALHHAVYSLVAGVVFDGLERALNKKTAGTNKQELA